MVEKSIYQKFVAKVRPEFIVGIFMVLAILVIYSQTISFDFVLLDDDVYVTNNPHFNRGLRSESIKQAFSQAHGGFWIPLTWVSYMIDSQLYGMKPGGYHMTNVLFHILNTLLVFTVFRKMTGNLWRSGFIAAMFAVHPLHVESVAWVAERKDLLFAFFWLLTMWGYLHYVRQPGIKRYLPVLLFFSAGLMAKPMIVTLPFVLSLLDYWPLKRIDFQKISRPNTINPVMPVTRLVLEKLPLLTMAVFVSILTYTQQKSFGDITSLKTSPIVDRFANAFISYVKYIANLIWPRDLTVLYPYPNAWPIWQAAGSCLMLGLLSGLVIKYFRKYPYLIVGWLWFLGTLVPVIGIIQFGAQPMADRYTYVTFIGLYIMIAWGIAELLGNWRYKKVVLASATTVILLALMISARTQTAYWTNSIRLFNHAIEVTRDNFLAHRNLGLALSYRGELDKALGHFKTALRINPKSARSYNDIGTYLMLKGRYDDSMGYFQKALYLQPDFPKAHNNLGLVLMSKKNYAEAAGHFQAALLADPDFKSARHNLEKAIAALNNSSS
ncbi:MAG: tetratricopeptide repeat protein [Desulfobacterales bacterium]